MAESDEDIIVDMKHYFSEAYALDFEPYSKHVNNILDHLIKSEILNYKNSDVLVIGRKGVSLFQPYIKTVNRENNLQGIFTIQLFSHSKHPIIKMVQPHRYSDFKPLKQIECIRKRFYGKVILLTDAINSGNEISEVIKTIDPKNISKICGYLANKDCLSELQKKYPRIQFSFIKIVNKEEYTLEQDRLQLIYHSRLIPIDGEHPYQIYSLKYQLSPEDLVNHMDNIFSKFKLAETNLKKDELLVPNISSYTINLDYNILCQENPELIQQVYDIERLQVRFKIDPKESKLRIMALALVNNTDIDINKQCNIEYKTCGINILKKMCETISIPHPMKDKPQEKICPLCIDLNISNFIIFYAEKELFKILESNGVKIDKMEI